MATVNDGPSTRSKNEVQFVCDLITYRKDAYGCYCARYASHHITLRQLGLGQLGATIIQGF
jgi:hypothetical protein